MRPAPAAAHPARARRRRRRALRCSRGDGPAAPGLVRPQRIGRASPTSLYADVEPRLTARAAGVSRRHRAVPAARGPVARLVGALHPVWRRVRGGVVAIDPVWRRPPRTPFLLHSAAVPDAARVPRRSRDVGRCGRPADPACFSRPPTSCAWTSRSCRCSGSCRSPFYLLTFIVCFSGWYRRSMWIAAPARGDRRDGMAAAPDRERVRAGRRRRSPARSSRAAWSATASSCASGRRRAG